MGIKVFRADSWARVKSGVISRRDFMGLDPSADGELIAYLMAHASGPCRRSMMKYDSGKYVVDPREPRVNVDDPDDGRYEEYVVLQEQVARETSKDALREAALRGSDYDMVAFAFCRLTGYSFPPSECDAYSYRTFGCESLPEVTSDDIRVLCQTIIAEEGALKDAAWECLRDLSEA